MNEIKGIIERGAFGVCSYLGKKIGITSARVRVYFIYITFVALGSPLIIYLFAAFWLNIREYLREKISTLE